MFTLVTACCDLHNMYEMFHNNFDQQWLDDVVIGLVRNIPSNATSFPSSSTAISILITLELLEQVTAGIH